ncbi:O-methyltransferase [Kingella kingae]|uniref:O-methyltransferase n=1 Tax=Kingella kingae TaxID=504 RepID=UPI000409FD00|nr:O-methyltransferase [Kingella kingae]MBD3614587.1 O-methyltransferase [Kingella kingae]MBD3632920.1 O-methyltransferase [Kingella kingae]MBD3660242.1 O-methyltransferase [Kingella kingae]MDK4575923.1 O-methyltransferase [Kingella kingae]MDK4581911.1 O-methyltransferase [Kingella kingae]
MTVQATNFTPELLDYLRQISATESPVLAQIRAQTAQHRLGKMAIAPEQSALLTWLAQLLGVRKYLEVGVFTGYSSTAMALALPDDAQLTCCDINVTFTDEAQQHWCNAGVSHKITLHLQPALITMDELIAAGESNSYDMAFIDADKPPTPHYFERALQLVRSGGIIAIDNLLLGGRIVQAASAHSPASHAILRDFNASLPHDSRIVPLTLPLGDGLTLVRKK